MSQTFSEKSTRKQSAKRPTVKRQMPQKQSLQEQKQLMDWGDRESFVLSEINLHNWGPFGGRHTIGIDPGGTAIIGPTGSGKTTLVDALMTLIVAQPKYNLASSGGHESDRNLLSYVRGVSGGGDETGDHRLVARTSKTVTGIAACFSNHQHSVQLAALIWMDGTSFANADRKDLWIFAEGGEQNLDDWLQAHHEGGARGLKQLGRELSGLRVFDTKKAYLAHVRRFFEVNDNAFMLLNRAAGLKQLSSVDEIFRELVLDDRAMFERASEVASEFDDLTEIHRELLVAREQQESLLPIDSHYKTYLSQLDKQEKFQQLDEILPVWFAMTGEKICRAKCEMLGQQLSELGIAIEEKQRDRHSHLAMVDKYHELYLAQGGGTIEELEKSIESQQRWVSERQGYVNDYQILVGRLQLDPLIKRVIFDKNQQQGRQREKEVASKIQVGQEAVYETGVLRKECTEKIKSLSKELSLAKSRPDSNIPADYQAFRQKLAGYMEMAETALPFIAELVEVQQEHVSWRGAIERAIGGHRLRLLVPENSFQSALTWVNDRNNRLHVRLLEASSADRPANQTSSRTSKRSRDFLGDGFAKKLNFKPHPFRESMKELIASVDRHCVASVRDLRQTPFAMTVEGSMSGQSGYFEKRDRHPISSGWVTGFSNKDLLANLGELLKQEQQSLEECEATHGARIKTLEKLQSEQTLLSALCDLEFEKIDLPSVQQELNALQKRLEILTNPESDATKAKAIYDEACQQRDEFDEHLRKLMKSQAIDEERLHQAQGKLQSIAQRVGEGLNDEQVKLAQAGFRVLDTVEIELLDQSERDAAAGLKNKNQINQDKLLNTEKQLVRHMGIAKGRDTGALAEVASEIEDIPEYLNQLKKLNQEALPEKLDRFQSYLNQASDQGVTQLLAEIDAEVSDIEERIEELNKTLKRVDFQEARLLQLVPKRVIHESLRELERARSHLRSAMLKDDQGESHYQALQNLVRILREASDNRRQQRSRALLDPRYRLQFAYAVVDSASGETIEVRTSSRGGSGGEKEIIASYILTASLSYALCPRDSMTPLFGTVVLDEAFSKSSQVVASRIISALKEFRLHALFVTPNKEMQLLRQHTRSAVLVHRKGFQSTLTPLSWKEIDEQTKKRKKDEPKIT